MSNATTDQGQSASSKLGRAFWMLCTMEMWERLAYYGMRVVVGVYIAQADEPGGLHFTQEQRGSIFAWWFVFQSVLPTFTGGLADRYGYKKTIAFSVALKVVGYVLMAEMREYWSFFLGTMLLATGTALFKPGIQGSLAQTLDEGKSSKGWGIFYWLVNVGAMIGPPLAGYLRGEGWSWVFYGCAGIVSLNFLMLFTYKELDSGSDKDQDFFEVMRVTFRNLFEARLVAFLLIMSGFWLMMYQLWDLHPLFITDWIDSGPVYEALSGILPESWVEAKERGTQVKQENLLNLNAALIVLFVVPLSIAVRKIKTLTAMLGGMVVATVGILVAGLTQSGWVFLLGVVFFSFGEMFTGPKKNEYLGLIAPPGKKGLYLGYVNIPVGIGGFVGSKLAGWLYGHNGEKAVLAQKYFAEHTERLAELGTTWNGDVEGLEAAVGYDRTQAYAALCEHLGKSGQEVTDLLWQTYSPYEIWYPIAIIGVVSIFALLAYNRAARGWADMNK